MNIKSQFCLYLETEGVQNYVYCLWKIYKCLCIYYQKLKTFTFYKSLCLDLRFLQVSRVSMSFEREFCEARFSSFFVCSRAFEAPWMWCQTYNKTIIRTTTVKRKRIIKGKTWENLILIKIIHLSIFFIKNYTILNKQGMLKNKHNNFWNKSTHIFWLVCFRFFSKKIYFFLKRSLFSFLSVCL